MGIGTEVRKVRDASRPYGRRFRALAGCIERYSPIGFENTWIYLTQRVGGDLRRDETAMVEAVDLIEASRAVRTRREAEFAVLRRAEKAAGRRSPGRSWEQFRFERVQWHGDEAGAARCVLAAWSQRRPPRPADSTVAAVEGLVEVVLESPAMWADWHRELLDDVHDTLESGIERVLRQWRETGNWASEQSYALHRLQLTCWHVAVALEGSSAFLPGTSRTNKNTSSKLS